MTTFGKLFVFMYCIALEGIACPLVAGPARGCECVCAVVSPVVVVCAFRANKC